MMTRDEFNGYVRDHIKGFLPEDMYPEGTSVMLEEVEKIGGLKLTGVCIRKPGETIAPVVYLDEYYKVYQNGAPINLVLEEIKNVDARARDNVNVPRLRVEDLDFDAVRDRIIIQPCDKELNKDYLQAHPHMNQGDLSATYRVLVGQNDLETMSIAVNDRIADMWGIRLDELHETALENMRKNTPPELHEITSLVNDTMFGGETENLLDDGADVQAVQGPVPAMYVLRYNSGGNGAACVFDPGVMERAAGKLGANCFVLPSSRHEVMLVKDDGAISFEKLRQMVREVNQNVVEPRDFLSDYVQYYDRSQKKVLSEKEYFEAKVIDAEEKQEQKQEQKPMVPKL